MSLLKFRAKLVCPKESKLKPTARLQLNNKIQKKTEVAKILCLFTAPYSHVSLERVHPRTSPELLACVRDDRSEETSVSTALRPERLKANLS